MAYELPPLPYDYAALEPYIDTETMKLHHDKHHQAYVTNANGALEKHPELAKKSADDLLRDLNAIPEDVRTVLRNNAGGHSNHSMFWAIMGPAGHGHGGAPSGDLADQIKREYKRLSGPETQTMLDFDDRDLVRWATEAGFPDFRSPGGRGC